MHRETHAASRIGWLRAAILGANDGIVSTASLIAGVAAAGASSSSILVTGTAGLVAGAMSMAAGEYVSVSSQGDAEKADIAKEKRELATVPDLELEELTQIYQQRGLDRPLAEQVAGNLARHAGYLVRAENPVAPPPPGDRAAIPAFKDIAAKYKGQDVAATLVQKVRTGGKGVYGPVPMPPSGADKISDADLKAAIDFILAG